MKKKKLQQRIPHTRAWKEKQLVELKKLIKEYPVIGIASLQNLPSALYQSLRKKLLGKVLIKVSNIRVIKKALTESRIAGIEKLSDLTEKNCALVFSKQNPFELFHEFKINKGSLFAKEGIIAEQDLIIPAGDTGLPPGPALTDLKNAGLKARMQGASIIIPDDTVVCKKGGIVNKAVSNALQKLGIKPVKVGLNIIAVFENNEIFSKEVLDIDTEKIHEEFSIGSTQSLNLAFNIKYINKVTLPLLISKAVIDSRNLSVNACILNKESLPLILGKAIIQATALNALVDFGKVTEIGGDKMTEEQTKKEIISEETQETPKEEKTEAPQAQSEEKKDVEKKDNEKKDNKKKDDESSDNSEESAKENSSKATVESESNSEESTK